MKKTSVTPSATLDQMPSPSHSVKIGASTTRGSALAIFTYGSNTAAMRGWRANQKPTTTPPNEPMTKARIDSASVTHRCLQITPATNQSHHLLGDVHGVGEEERRQQNVETEHRKSA